MKILIIGLSLDQNKFIKKYIEAIFVGKKEPLFFKTFLPINAEAITTHLNRELTHSNYDIVFVENTDQTNLVLTHFQKDKKIAVVLLGVEYITGMIVELTEKIKTATLQCLKKRFIKVRSSSHVTPNALLNDMSPLTLSADSNQVNYPSPINLLSTIPKEARKETFAEITRKRLVANKTQLSPIKIVTLNSSFNNNEKVELKKVLKDNHSNQLSKKSTKSVIELGLFVSQNQSSPKLKASQRITHVKIKNEVDKVFKNNFMQPETSKAVNDTQEGCLGCVIS